MRSTLNELPAVFEVPDGTVRQVDWGGLTVETGTISADMDPSPFFKGLPDDRCQCPHWGYVLKGTLRYRYADREEVYQAGDVYYAPPGHLPFLGAGTEYVEFSPADKLAATMEVVGKNFAAMQG